MKLKPNRPLASMFAAMPAKAKPRASVLKAMPPEFSITKSLRRATELLSAPPPEDWIVRPEPVGKFVARFVLPVDLLKPSNWTRHRQIGTVAGLKDKIFKKMSPQHPYPRSEVLPGRPFVRCIRFSPRAPDASSDWAKLAVDMLMRRVPITPQDTKAKQKAKGRRMNFIYDDSPRYADIRQHWEPCHRADAFCLIEVWEGDPLAKTPRDTKPPRAKNKRPGQVAARPSLENPAIDPSNRNDR